MDRTEEPPLYEGLFLAKDEEVATFVDLVRGNMRSVRKFWFVYYDCCIQLLFKIILCQNVCVYMCVFLHRQMTVLFVALPSSLLAEKWPKGLVPK